MGRGGRGASERPFLPSPRSRLHPQNDGKRLEQDGHGLAGLKLEHTGALGGDDGADGGAFVEGDEDFGFDFSELDALHLAGEVVAGAGGRVAGADDDPRSLDRRGGVDAFAEFEVVGAFSRDDGDDLKAVEVRISTSTSRSPRLMRLMVPVNALRALVFFIASLLIWEWTIFRASSREK